MERWSAADTAFLLINPKTLFQWDRVQSSQIQTTISSHLDLPTKTFYKYDEFLGLPSTHSAMHKGAPEERGFISPCLGFFLTLNVTRPPFDSSSPGFFY